MQSATRTLAAWAGTGLTRRATPCTLSARACTTPWASHAMCRSTWPWTGTSCSTSSRLTGCSSPSPSSAAPRSPRSLQSLTYAGLAGTCSSWLGSRSSRPLARSTRTTTPSACTRSLSSTPPLSLQSSGRSSRSVWTSASSTRSGSSTQTSRRTCSNRSTPRSCQSSSAASARART